MGDKEQRDIFKKNLIYYVDHCGHSQKEIAEAIGVSPQTFNTWMRGIALPRMGKVELLASFFNIKKSDLIDSHEMPAILDLAEDAILIETIRALDSDRKKRLMEYANYLLYQQNKDPQDK